MIAIPENPESMKAEYDRCCTTFLLEGNTFYFHGRDCECHNCQLTRAKNDGMKGRLVTLHDWKRDQHWYQTLGAGGDVITKEQAAYRCLAIASGVR